MQLSSAKQGFIKPLGLYSRAYHRTGLAKHRLPRLRQLLQECEQDRVVRIMETHNGLTGLIVETARATRPNGQQVEFDGFWSSSLTASAAHGKPDIETVDTTSRLKLVEDVLEVTTKPLIYDADTGGHSKVFAFTVQTLERMGVSACIIEDKTGLKQNSLFGTERKQVLETIENFQEKIIAGQDAKREEDFMIVARLEALIAGYGEAEALKRAEAFIDAGADAIMIHSKEKSPAEVLSFLDNYHKLPRTVPVVAVPTTYNVLTEADLHNAGANICIYANHLLRSAYPNMVECCQSILTNSRSLEMDNKLLPVKDIIRLIDEGAGAGTVRTDTAFTGGKGKSNAGSGASQQLDPKRTYDHMRSSGLNFFTGVPDSLLAPLCKVITAEMAGELPTRHVIAANEGAAVATAAGYHLATGEVPVVYLQNSGLGNTVNPIMSLAHSEVYGVPMILLIGWRGAPGTKDEPQHIVQGRQTQTMLESMNVASLTLPHDPDKAEHVIDNAVAMAKKNNQPVALLVPPKTFSKPVPGSIRDMPEVSLTGSDGSSPTREDAIEGLLASGAIAANDVIVSTTGFTSRELYELREKLGQGHSQDFLTVGSMGHAVAIAQGIALASPGSGSDGRTVWCLDGDGSALMHMGNLATTGAEADSLTNLRHVLLNNGVHDSVGGQPTAGQSCNFADVAKAAGYKIVRSVSNLESAMEALEVMSQEDGPHFLELLIKRGHRSDLGRPKTTTHDAKNNFMNHIGTD